MSKVDELDRAWSKTNLGDDQSVQIFLMCFDALWPQIKTMRASQSEADSVAVPREIDRSKHRNVLAVWNNCMANYETLEMTWPKLVAAFSADEESK